MARYLRLACSAENRCRVYGKFAPSGSKLPRRFQRPMQIYGRGVRTPERGKVRIDCKVWQLVAADVVHGSIATLKKSLTRKRDLRRKDSQVQGTHGSQV